jgi:hypothetical protein
MTRFALALASCLTLNMSVTAATAQDTAAQGNTLLVFMDCQARNCDFDHFRREVTWVNWVRDRQDAELHVLITSQQTGGGGLDYSLDFIGRRQFEGQGDALRYISDPDDTDAEVRDGLTQAVSLGLVRYAASTTVGPQLRVTFDAPQREIVQSNQADDPWKLWVFRLNVNGSADGEAQERGYSLGGSASANQTREDRKINWTVSGRYNRDEFDTDDSTTVVNVRENYSSNLLGVWSLSPHWSAGGVASAARSSFNNLDFGISSGPAIEYDIYPYHESTRRAIIFRYSVEIAHFEFHEVTVEGKLQDTRPRHALAIAADIAQPWGEVFGSVTGTQYLDSPATHRIDFFTFVEFRIFRGLNFNVNGRFSRIKDQFFLPAEELTEEDILLRRSARETDFRYRIGIGLSYRFGSMFANIVNPRFRGAGGFF